LTSISVFFYAMSCSKRQNVFLRGRRRMNMHAY
jgi:hypothetical protein